MGTTLFVTVAVPDSLDTQPVVEELEISTASKHDPLKRLRKNKCTVEELELRVNAAYMLMLSGGSRRENCNKLAEKYNVTYRQAENYYFKAQQLMKTDMMENRQDLLNQVNNMRLHTIQKALKRGNLQVVAHLLDSLARSAGEGTAEQEASHAPTLNISIQPARANGHSLQPVDDEPLQLEPVTVEAIHDRHS